MLFKDVFPEFSFVYKDKNKFGIDYREVTMKNENPRYTVTFVELPSDFDFINLYISDFTEFVLKSFIKNGIEAEIKVFFAFKNEDILSLNFYIILENKKIYKSFNFDLVNKILLFPSSLLSFFKINLKQLKIMAKKAGDYIVDESSVYLLGDSLKFYAKDRVNGEPKMFRMKIT